MINNLNYSAEVKLCIIQPVLLRIEQTEEIYIYWPNI